MQYNFEIIPYNHLFPPAIYRGQNFYPTNLVYNRIYGALTANSVSMPPPPPKKILKIWHCLNCTSQTAPNSVFENLAINFVRVEYNIWFLELFFTIPVSNLRGLQKLSKHDESFAQHLKSLQQQLVEETKRSKRDNAKLAKMVKQHLLEEKKRMIGKLTTNFLFLVLWCL